MLEESIVRVTGCAKVPVIFVPSLLYTPKNSVKTALVPAGGVTDDASASTICWPEENVPGRKVATPDALLPKLPDAIDDPPSSGTSDETGIELVPPGTDTVVTGCGGRGFRGYPAAPLSEGVTAINTAADPTIALTATDTIRRDFIFRDLSLLGFGLIICLIDSTVKDIHITGVVASQRRLFLLREHRF